MLDTSGGQTVMRLPPTLLLVAKRIKPIRVDFWLMASQLFNWMSKAIQGYFRFNLLRCVIGLESLHHALSRPIRFKLKPIATTAT